MRSQVYEWLKQRKPFSIIIVEYVPSWFSGAGFKRKAKEWENLLPDVIDKPFEDLDSHVVS